MKITWLGHASFRIEMGGEVLLVDPWLTGNPSFPDDQRAAAIAGASAILLTHGHFDHVADVEDVAKDTGATIYGIVELAGTFEGLGHKSVGFNMGGTVQVGDVAVTMVRALHSSIVKVGERYMPAGDPAGFILRAGGRSLYISGDTDVHADMGLIAERYAPDTGILCCGGHFTMDMEGAAFAAKKFFNFETVIPCHYGTFPILAQSADPLVAALPGVDVKVPKVMEMLDL